MRKRSGLSSLFGKLGKDDRGTVLVQFTVYLVAIMGMIGLSLDGGRYLLLNSSLQDLADAAALAGAADLDGTNGARTLATSDAQAMANKNPPRWYDVADTQTISVSFFSALDPDTAAAGDKDAKYIKVTTASNWKVVPTFLAAVGASPNPTGATAWAQATSAQCLPSSMMLCNPSEPATGGTGDTSSFIANTTAGQMFIFSTTGNTGGYSPGVFNLLDAPTGSGSDTAITQFLSQQYAGACYTQGTSPAQGQKTSATTNGINVRFDQPPSGNASGVDETPAPIKIDGFNNKPSGNSCKITSAVPKNFVNPTSFTDPTTTCNQSGYSCPLPRDRTMTSVGGTGGSQIGTGPGSTDLQAYWTNHHPGPYPGYTTRWAMYQDEVNGVGNAGTWLTNTVEQPEPQCLSAGTPPEYSANRRILHVAVVDCVYWGVTGNKVNNIPINTYADFFLTEASNGNIYTEFVGAHQINAIGSLLHRIVQLVR